MLDVLRRIVQEVSTARDLDEALRIIVNRVREALGVDVCSVYQALPDQSRLVLKASVGLNPEAVGKVSLAFGEGLVGLVAQRAEPINLERAPEHPDFRLLPETGEEAFQAFLGVPIIHQRRLLGVLVVQNRAAQRFNEDHLSLLVTLAAQLAGAISHAEAAGQFAEVEAAPQSGIDLRMEGVPGAPGVAVGSAAVVFPAARLDSVPDRVSTLPEVEIQMFRDAVVQVQEELMEIKQRMTDVLPAEERALFDAYVMMLNSETLVEATIERIRAGNWAPGALRETIHENARVFEQMEDPYLRERASDLRDLGERILARLQSSQERRTGWPQRTILVGEEISATQLAEVPREALVGVVSASGTGSSHVAILARAMGIPTVMGVTDLPVERMEGREVIVDGYQGHIYLQPSERVRAEYLRLYEEEQRLGAELREHAAEPAVTPDGERIPVLVNGGLVADLKPSYIEGADGVGLYRTEIPFMIRERFPAEEEQFELYRQVLEAFAPRPVTLRTLDVGGDKPLPYFRFEEDNPFLGWRGIRITLDHPEIFLTQIRAMLRASEGLDNLQILLPMVTSTGEVEESCRLIEQAWQELSDEGCRLVYPRVGVMVEVPAAVYLTPALARRVDFISVGTNDLIQYLLAVDRNNAHVADLYDSLHPAVLQALVQIVDGARHGGKPVSVCGEMAAIPEAAILLLGMGYDSLSVSVAALPRIKQVIRGMPMEECRALAREALDLESSDEIRARLRQALIDHDLGGLIRPGLH